MNSTVPSVRILGSFEDAYIYSGYLIAVFTDGSVRGLSMDVIHDCAVALRPQHEALLRLTLLRNDWLDSEQGRLWLAIPSVSKALVADAELLSVDPLVVDVPVSEWEMMCAVPVLPVLDIRAYGMRLFVCTDSGLFELCMESTGYGRLGIARGLERILDARVVYVTSRIGGVAASAENAGVFFGSIPETTGDRTRIVKQVSLPSVRTGWSAFDVVNYTSQTSFDYIRNHAESLRDYPVWHSTDGEAHSKMRVTSFATETFEQLENSMPEGEPPSLLFNSSDRLYLIAANGQVQSAGIDRSSATPQVRRMRIETQSPIPRKLGRALSAFAFRKSLVVEFFEYVVLFSGATRTTLVDRPVVSVRSFQGSRRWKNTILTCDEEGLTLHAVLPQAQRQ